MLISKYSYLKRIAGKLARFSVNFVPQGQSLPIVYGKLRGKKWIVNSAGYSCWTGTYELEKQFMFQTLVSEESVVFDVGAHVGFYTMLASVLVGPDGQVFAFEPLPRNIAYIKKHLSLNGLTNVRVVETAVSNRDDTLSFRKTPDSSMGYIAADGELQVKTICLDTFIETEKIPPPEYIKIDVEGAEKEVLLGAKYTLNRFHPTLFLATHGKDIYQECVELLENLDYKLERIDSKNEFKRCELLAYQ